MERWSIGLIILVLVLCVSVPACSGGNPPASPFENLRKQIDELAGRIGTIEDRFTPPEISYTLTCTSTLDADLGLTVKDDREIAYYVIQRQGRDPPLNYVYYVEPGLKEVQYSISIGTLEDYDILLAATDTFGNMVKDMVHIEHNTCLPPCEPGQECPP